VDSLAVMRSKFGRGMLIAVVPEVAWVVIGIDGVERFLGSLRRGERRRGLSEVDVCCVVAVGEDMLEDDMLWRVLLANRSDRRCNKASFLPWYWSYGGLGFKTFDLKLRWLLVAGVGW